MVPTYLYTSWKHNPGEMRIFLEGQEVVQHRSLAAHVRYRWREYWRAEPPIYPSERFERDREEYEGKAQADNYRVGDGEPSNAAEYAAVCHWANPDIPRRIYHNRAGNQYSP